MAKVRTKRASKPGRSASGRHRTEPDPIAARVGRRIRALRIEAEFAFDAFVEETGLGRGYISELERGLVVPTVGTLSRIATALEITMADLVLGDSERERLFDELRGATNALVRELRARVRRAGEHARPGVEPDDGKKSR